MSDAPVFVALTAEGAALARRLMPDFPGSELHGLAHRVRDAEHLFTDTMGHVADLFRSGRAIVGICASGILIRAVAPHLADKRNEPPLIAMSADGLTAVPLLGGHRGANRLARALADATGGAAALTTAGEILHGVALDDPPPGWRIANPEAAKAVMAGIIAGETIGKWGGAAGWLDPLGLKEASADDAHIHVTTRAMAPDSATLNFHPPRLVLGVGCERDCAPEELIGLAAAALAEAGYAGEAVALVASIDVKADEPAVHALAAHLGVEARFLPAEVLEAETPRLATPSDVVFREVGCHGVSEGAALASVGAEGSLVVAKRKSKRATIAIAESPTDIDPRSIGQARGHLAIVGVGPGAPDWRTGEAARLLRQADEIVGYGFYLDLVADLLGDKPRHSTDLGAEEARARKAIELAAQGRRVALVCSGDAGIYALATLVWELLDSAAAPGWSRIAVEVAPGVSALQAAAARAGAPIGHDFCAVSLSDLLTPRERILARIRAAAEGDFVTALYNPRSLRRTELIRTVIDIFRAHRPPETPVVVARSLGRPDEAVSIVPISEFDPDTIDMMTILLIGASQTRRMRHDGKDVAYTPRGYLSPV